MDNKADFIHYLKEQKKTTNIITKCSHLFDKLLEMIKTKLPTTEEIGVFVEEIARHGLYGDGKGSGNGAAKEVYKFLEEYVRFCGNSSSFAAVYHEHLRQAFEEPAREAISCLKKSIVFIPDDTIIDPYFLGEMNNEEFVKAFKLLQEFVYAVYEEIERTSPFEWGWKGASEIGGYDIYHNRVLGVLLALVEHGYVEDDVLIVDKDKFWDMRDKKQVIPIVKGLLDMGLSIEGFDDKATDTFTVSHLDTPQILTVLKAYTKERRRECCRCHKHDVYPCQENCNQMKVGDHREFGILSHRFVQKHSSDIHDTEVLMMAIADSAPPELAEILRYLHEEATRHGFRIMPWTVAHGGCINHCQFTDNWGAKMWMRVGSGTYWGDFFYKMQTGNWAVKPYMPSKPLFKSIFKKYPEKANELLERFPDSFVKNGEEYHFDFQNPTLVDVKFLLELYKLENNIH